MNAIKKLKETGFFITQEADDMELVAAVELTETNQQTSSTLHEPSADQLDQRESPDNDM